MNHLLGQVLVGLLLGLSPMVAAAQEESVPLDKVPKPVMEAFKARFKDAKLTGASKEVEDGKLVYEVTFKDKGLNVDVTLSADGKLLMIEKEINRKDLPKAVTTALEGKYPKAEYKIVEELVQVEGKKETLTSYEVLLTTTDKKAWEVVIAPDGKIIKVEDKSKEVDETKKKKAKSK